jgi:hypothetical protein
VVRAWRHPDCLLNATCGQSRKQVGGTSWPDSSREESDYESCKTPCRESTHMRASSSHGHSDLKAGERPSHSGHTCRAYHPCEWCGHGPPSGSSAETADHRVHRHTSESACYDDTQ